MAAVVAGGGVVMGLMAFMQRKVRPRARSFCSIKIVVYMLCDVL
jgi:hypothetical protein